MSLPISSWPSVAAPPVLAGDEVHVWCAALDLPAGGLDSLTAVLSAEEKERARRFVSVPARQQFQVARGLLRTLLGRYLDRDPRGIAFGSGPAGKPVLADGPGLHFNVSHTHGLALVAITRLGEVGVDLERVRPFRDELGMAERFFTAAEAAALRALAGARRREAFFHVWTRKEAYLKACGLGLAHGLERFEVSVPPDDPPRVRRIDGMEELARRWSLHALEPLPGYVGTLALEGQGFRLCCRRWVGE